jgi:glycolate dehydrogenase FAD-binding subunit
MADQILRALSAACPSARPAGPGDAVAGAVPRYAADPAGVEQASALLRAAAEHGLAVVPTGGGSKQAWGVPPRRCDLVVGTGSMNAVIEHAAGDLVARVQAGLTLADLAQVLAGSGQQLALDPPPGAPGAAATVGGTLATAAAGPRRLRYGTPRDLVIGITVVRADGTVARSGGKVVKNVAGYDLGKLFAGSFGTLGLIAEAVFRLHPLPGGTAYVTVDCPDAAAAHRAVAGAVASELAPSAVEIDRRGRAGPVRVSVLLEGDADGVTERAALMRALLGGGAEISPEPPAWWGWQAQQAGNGQGQPGGNGQGQPAEKDQGQPGGNRQGQPGGNAGWDGQGTLVRLAFWASALPRILALADAAASAAGLDPAVGGSAAAGVIYAAVGPDADPAAVATFVAGLRAAVARGEGDARPAPAADTPPVLASAVVVHAPPAVRERGDLWGPVPSLSLMAAVKDQFDPGHRMAPGRFVGGL